MQIAKLTKGQRIIALVNIYGRTGFDARQSQWMTVEVIQPGVSSAGPGPVHIKTEVVETVESQLAAWINRRGSGRYTLVRTVEADKGAGEPGYLRPGHFFVVGPHQLIDLAGYLARTQAARDKQAAREAAREARSERMRIERIDANLARLATLADVEGFPAELRATFTRLVREERIEIN